MNKKQLSKLGAAIAVATMMTACGGGSSGSGGGGSSESNTGETGTTVTETGNGFVVFPAAEASSAVAIAKVSTRANVSPKAALPAEYLYKTDGTAAGTVKIVDDNNNGFEVGRYRSGYMAELDGTFYFAGKDSNGDVELWATDGTGAGTERVADIYANGSAQPYDMVPAAGKLFMNAVVDDASGVGRELVVFDPASDAHQVLTTIVGNDDLESLTAVDGGLFFFDESASNNDVYFTDGTVAGTVKVATEAGAAPAGSPLSTYPHDIYDSDWLGYNGKLLFTGYKDSSDYKKRLYELDQDGNIKEIAFNDGGSTVQLEITENVVTSNDKVYFVADKGTSTSDLNIFEYDGSTVTNLSASEANKPYEDRLVGTSLGVFMYVEQSGVTPYLLRVNNANSPAGIAAALRSTGDYSFSDVEYMVEANGTVFFAADTEGTGGADFGTELWKTDGTSQGTELVKDINDTGVDEGSEPFPLTFMYQVAPAVNGDLGSKYLFVANNGSDGYEPWVSDGSEDGTVILKDISAGSGSSVGD
ncbi:hyalin [Marinobacter sp. AL4B]|uniref:hyalin n=1 Tax=Marinobacter sp. AL4B TaxID=2871173 RepID=UPI001CAA5A50|nr:hyalin [Marinobacter sp. AL4B]MBZ0335628.1 hyalin [Marinobacter sp. AL4B]